MLTIVAGSSYRLVPLCGAEFSRNRDSKWNTAVRRFNRSQVAAKIPEKSVRDNRILGRDIGQQTIFVTTRLHAVSSGPASDARGFKYHADLAESCALNFIDWCALF
jgi:hypothetical protein